MDLQQFIAYLREGNPVRDAEMYRYLYELSNEAMRITAELNGSYRTPDEIQRLMSALTGKPIDDTFGLFPPFYTDCGKNTTIGKKVFINSGCHFQDQGGITIGDNSLIGHNVTLATLNHGIAPEDRQTLYPAPIVIEPNVWIGAGTTVVPGVTIGENAIVGAGSVVTKNVPKNTVVAGVPAKFIRSLKG